MQPWYPGAVRDLSYEWMGSRHYTRGFFGNSDAAKGTLLTVSRGHPLASFETKLEERAQMGTIECQTSQHRIGVRLDARTIRVVVNGGVFMQIVRRQTGEIYDGYQQRVGRLLRGGTASTLVWDHQPIAIVYTGGDCEDELPVPRRRRIAEDHMRSDHHEMAVFVVALLETALFGVTSENEGQRVGPLFGV
jgi:hypothetical protein